MGFVCRTVIDNNADLIRRATDALDVQGVTGFASHPDILDRAGVAVTPGVDFDPGRGAETLRFSYARSPADIAEGLDRLARYMAGR